jgi:hypothetical protein
MNGAQRKPAPRQPVEFCLAFYAVNGVLRSSVRISRSPEPSATSGLTGAWLPTFPQPAFDMAAVPLGLAVGTPIRARHWKVASHVASFRRNPRQRFDFGMASF